MGQSTSQPQRLAEDQSEGHNDRGDRQRRRRSTMTLLNNLHYVGRPDPGDDAGVLLSNQDNSDDAEARPSSRPRLSRLLSSPTNLNLTSSPARSALQRSRSTLSSMFRRNHPGQSSENADSRPHQSFRRRTSYMRAGNDSNEAAALNLPRLPSIDQSDTFGRDLFNFNEHAEEPPRSAHSHRLSALRLRSERPFRHFPSLRRRRVSPPGPPRRTSGPEDQALLLSQLLSAAAAATAATLMGDDHHALTDARSLSLGNIGDMAGGGENGSFAGFLRALSSGRFASTLRQGGDGVEEVTETQSNALNFFRMFRFGSSGTGDNSRGSPQVDTQAAHSPEDTTANGAAPAEGRMIPIIIVGIRSISPSSNSNNGATDELPPFLDALTNFTSPTTDSDELDPLGQNSIDSILRPPHNGTSFRHRRRASMGGFGLGRNRIHDRYDDQRDHRSPDRHRERPWSTASSTSEPRPPPATPASPSPELSRISSANSTPSPSRPASLIANSVREIAGDRSSFLRRSLSSPLASHTEEILPSSAPQEQPAMGNNSSLPWSRRAESHNAHYPRFASGHPRRNGVVEPDHMPSLSRTSSNAGVNGSARSDDGRSRNDSRSWIIYVLGGSYPENHPILTTPSLFSDNPTYEDMMLLSTLLGPAKAPVATDEDVQNAGGIYVTMRAEEPIATTEQAGTGSTLSGLVAVAVATDDGPTVRIALETDHKCLVCLFDFEVDETLRRLGNCGHFFHKECIDHWLTQGRNSCPLCRGEGVEEKARADPAPADPAPHPIAA